MFWRYNFLSVGWLLLILVLSFLPGKDLPQVGFFQFDKLVHVLFYLILFVFTYIGWKKQQQLPALQQASVVQIAIGCSVIGLMIECGQHLFTADRYFDMFDALANSIGALAGLTTTPYLKSYFSIR